jgi:hypothetical protein
VYYEDWINPNSELNSQNNNINKNPIIEVNNDETDGKGVQKRVLHKCYFGKYVCYFITN